MVLAVAACEACQQLCRTHVLLTSQQFFQKFKLKLFSSENGRKKAILLCSLTIFLLLYFCFPEILQRVNISKLYHAIFLFLDKEANNQALRSIIICILVIIVSFPFTWGYVLINIATGYWCGILQGTATMSISAVIGMSCAWKGVRRLNKSKNASGKIFKALSKLVGSEEKLSAIMEPLADPKKAWTVLLMLRATPLPFGMINALFAITKLPFSSFLLWSWLGLIPMQMVNCYIGSRLATISEVMQDKGGYMSVILLLTQLILSVLLVYCSIRVTRRKFERLNHIDKAPDGSFYV